MRVLVEELSSEAIGRIEQRMRPGRDSAAGFLGGAESLVDVITRDRQTLSDRMLTPGQIGHRLESIVGQACRLLELSQRGLMRIPRGSLDSLLSGEKPGIEVEGRYLVSGIGWMGRQQCPFEDERGHRCEDLSYASSDFTLQNSDTEEELTFPGLSIHLICDHEFFEGSVSYRVDPANAVAVLGLRPGEDYRPTWASELIWRTSSGMSQTPDAADGDRWKLLPEIRQALDDPEEIRMVADSAQFYLRGDLCVVVANGPWSLPPGTIISGGEWTRPDGLEGTWSFVKRSETYVVPVGFSGD